MLEIKPLDLEDAAELRAYADVRIAAHPGSSRERIIASLREANPDFGEVIRLIARRDGEGVGITSVGLLGGVNARLAIGPITVRPDHRRQGIGTALLERLLPELRDRGRDTFESWGVVKGSAGEHWAVARGFHVAASRVIQLLTVAVADPASWELDAPRGYRLEQWIGATPEHLLASVAATRQSIHDAPATESAVRAPEWTPEVVRAEEAEARADGVEQRVVVAVEEATGLVIALTDVPLHPGDSAHTRWGSTMVTPAHRGHGPIAARPDVEPRGQGAHAAVAGRGPARARTRRHRHGRVELPHDQGERAARLRHRPRGGRGQPVLLSSSVSTGRALTSCSREHALYPMTSPCSLGRFT
ncbi:GNAT family N-acetyltransferase [Lentzea sp. BCCO 10_0798]|uniref:GNAT family N-acetyltransferase n=1 Tax=Lentzea kristufekii TaxID=3095430 RepID=A0ABU4TJG1_9PSEU|nr:GNAT family N-acetyltransferase [Lentzea sp. BCCO 10_0798]MDX8048408.1 GNAT family N-acetyltransferase [Lentzea sp. BCCO 10_0798]